MRIMEDNMNKAYHEKVINDVIEQLKNLDIDAYVIITSEGSDRITSFIPGVGTVGSGAFIFTKNGKKYGISSKIDAQDIEESGLFDEVIKYDSYDESVSSLMKKLAPKKLALNYSEKDPFCDGLTMGRYQKFIESLGGEVSFEEVSSDCFIPRVRENNPL